MNKFRLFLTVFFAVAMCGCSGLQFNENGKFCKTFNISLQYATMLKGLAAATPAAQPYVEHALFALKKVYQYMCVPDSLLVKDLELITDTTGVVK